MSKFPPNISVSIWIRVITVVQFHHALSWEVLVSVKCCQFKNSKCAIISHEIVSTSDLNWTLNKIQVVVNLMRKIQDYTYKKIQDYTYKRGNKGNYILKCCCQIWHCLTP